MSKKPYNICVPIPSRDGKTFWHNIGSAWDDGKGGFSLVFKSLPTPTYSEKYGIRVEAKIFPPRDDAYSGGGSGSGGGGGSGSAPLQAGGSGFDDDIPF